MVQTAVQVFRFAVRRWSAIRVSGPFSFLGRRGVLVWAAPLIWVDSLCHVMRYVRTPVSRLRCRRVSLKSCTCTLQNHMMRNVQSDNSHCTSNSNLRLYAEAIGHSHSSLAFRRHVQGAPAPHTPIHGRWPSPPLPVRDVSSRGLTALVNGSP